MTRLPDGQGRKGAFTQCWEARQELAFLVAALGSIAIVFGGMPFILASVDKGLDLVLSDKCLEPVEGFLECISRFPQAPNTIALSVGIPFSIVILIPWELARGLACERRKKRLFRILSVAVLFFWFPPIATWWEFTFVPSLSAALSPLRELVRLLQLFDINFWYVYRWSHPWGQLVPLVLMLSLLVEDEDRKSLPRLPGPSTFPKAQALRLGKAAALTLLLSGISYEAALAILALWHGKPGSEEHLDWLFLFQSAIPVATLVFLAVGDRWLLATEKQKKPGPTSEGREEKAIAVLSATGYVGVGLVLFSLTVLVFDAFFRIFPLDVVVDPRHARETVCPFLASTRITLGAWLLVGGFFLGEVAKLVTQELEMDRRTWLLAVLFQAGIVLPVAVSLLWPGIRLAALQLTYDVPVSQLVVQHAQETSHGVSQWLFLVSASVITWAYRRALTAFSSARSIG